MTGVAERRLRGEIEVDNRAEEVVDEAENTLEGGLEMGVSRSDENSKPGRFARCRESDGRVVDDDDEEGYMLLMHSSIRGSKTILFKVI